MFDVIVAGVGGMGSAAVYHLARRGSKVLGLERFAIPNELGSSHGLSRIIRLAYWEDAKYIPLLRRSYALWRELEREANAQLLLTTGSIDAGPEDSRSMRGVMQVCREFDLSCETMSAAALANRFPGYQLPESVVAVYQPDGGILAPERCIVAHVERARAMDAEVHANEEIIDWDADGDSVRVRTTRDTYRARHLVFTAGAWTGKLLRELAPVLSPERQVVLWTRPLEPALFQPEVFPVFYIHVDEGSFYGFPDHEHAGFKIGKYHHRREQVDPDAMNRSVSEDDEETLRIAVRRYFPRADGPTLQMKTCLFTNTADEHFRIQRLAENVSVAAGFSGHGFKFCSVVGEILADLSLEGETRHDISLFRL
ncbi:MAG TPA: N-methyl-L-tryptophan oxidase [Thermoanaerobaculia bacterium]|nr:N-methyl-L-tryptophan oxidase [Thermoanaerobaculia bacterium]